MDPFTGVAIAVLSKTQRADAGKSTYVIYRYGYDESAHRTISLTFGDGPDPLWTPQILDLLSRYGVPATFFLVGSEAVRHPTLINREVHEGHRPHSTR